MPGLAPGLNDIGQTKDFWRTKDFARKKDVDGRGKLGHDGTEKRP